MKSVFVLAAFVALALCQITIPASTNPSGEPYFSPFSVKQLLLNQTSSGVLPNSTTDYSDFYWFHIPSNIASFRTLVNGTDDRCDSYIDFYWNFVNVEEDSSISFPCTDSSTAFCDTYSFYDDVYGIDYETNTVDTYYFRPGKYAYLSVSLSYTTDIECPYTVSIFSDFECPNTSVVGYDYYDYFCIDNSTITTVASNGANYSGVLATSTQLDVYRVNVPENVTRVWAWITSNSSSLYTYATQGYVASSSSASDEYNYYYDDSNNSVYYFYLEIAVPDGNFPTYFSLEWYSSDPVEYNIAFYWSACGSNFAGYGDFDGSYGHNAFSIPDCSDPVTYNNVNLLATGNPSYVFNVPHYNSSVDNGYNGAYAFVAVPAGISGSVNFTCNSTNAYSFLVFSHNAQTDCYSKYVDSVSCSSSTYSTSDYLNLISQDLYTGGYWTIGACNGDSTNDAVITINTAGSVAAAASASPSSAASGVVNASASPDANSDSSVSNAIFPALFVIALAALVSF
jgi:hypothetical protein